MGNRIEFDEMDLDILDLLCPPLVFDEGETVSLTREIKVPQYTKDRKVRYVTLPIDYRVTYLYPSETLKDYHSVNVTELEPPHSWGNLHADGMVVNVWHRNLGRTIYKKDI
jgi:hypothetical protein